MQTMKTMKHGTNAMMHIIIPSIAIRFIFFSRLSFASRTKNNGFFPVEKSLFIVLAAFWDVYVLKRRIKNLLARRRFRLPLHHSLAQKSLWINFNMFCCVVLFSPFGCNECLWKFGKTNWWNDFGRFANWFNKHIFSSKVKKATLMTQSISETKFTVIARVSHRTTRRMQSSLRY